MIRRRKSISPRTSCGSATAASGVEDYKRLASWLFGGYVPKGNDPKVEEEVDLPQPVPVYMTYLTAQPTADGVQFLARPLRPRRAFDGALRPATDGGRPRHVNRAY